MSLMILVAIVFVVIVLVVIVSEFAPAMKNPLKNRHPFLSFSSVIEGGVNYSAYYASTEQGTFENLWLLVIYDSSVYRSNTPLTVNGRNFPDGSWRTQNYYTSLSDIHSEDTINLEMNRRGHLSVLGNTINISTNLAVYISRDTNGHLFAEPVSTNKDVCVRVLADAHETMTKSLNFWY